MPGLDKFPIRNTGGGNVYSNAMRLAEARRQFQERQDLQEREQQLREARFEQSSSIEERKSMLDSAKFSEEARKNSVQEQQRDQIIKLAQERDKTLNAQRQLQIQAEENQNKISQTQASQVTDALKDLGKLDPSDVNYRSKVLDIQAKYPYLGMESKNGFEKIWQNQVDKGLEANASHIKSVDEFAKAHGVNPIYNNDTGRADFEAMQKVADDRAMAVKEQSRQDLTSKGLNITGAQETEKGTELKFGQAPNPDKDFKSKYQISRAEAFAPDTKIEAGNFKDNQFVNDDSGTHYKVTAKTPTGVPVTAFVPKDEYNQYKASFNQTASPQASSSEQVPVDSESPVQAQQPQAASQKPALGDIFGGS